MSAKSYPSFFHTGIVVPDLEKAIARYSDILGVRFAEPMTAVVPVVQDPDPHPLEVTSTLSMTEPPYYELIQASGDGIFSRANSGRIMYYGLWETDMPGRLKYLEERDVGVEATFRMDPDGPPYAMFTSPCLMGARVEYVDASACKEFMTAWARSGKPQI